MLGRRRANWVCYLRALVDKCYGESTLSISIRGISEKFKITKHDRPDFARLKRRTEVIGLYMVEVRLYCCHLDLEVFQREDYNTLSWRDNVFQTPF